MTENRWTIRKNSKAFPDSTSLWGCLRTTRVDSDKKILLGWIIFDGTVCKFYGIMEGNVCIIIVFYWQRPVPWVMKSFWDLISIFCFFFFFYIDCLMHIGPNLERFADFWELVVVYF